VSEDELLMSVQGIEREMVRIADGMTQLFSVIAHTAKKDDGTEFEPMDEIEVIDLNGDIVKRFVAPK
jgi:hypothetical protein